MTTEVPEVFSTLPFETIYENERYIVRDALFGPMTVSVTNLHPEQATRGHTHPHPELLTVNNGSGILQLGAPDVQIEDRDGETEWISLMPGVSLVIPGNAYHRVVTASGIEFTNVFEGKRAH